MWRWTDVRDGHIVMLLRAGTPQLVKRMFCKKTFAQNSDGTCCPVTTQALLRIVPVCWCTTRYGARYSQNDLGTLCVRDAVLWFQDSDISEAGFLRAVVRMESY